MWKTFLLFILNVNNFSAYGQNASSNKDNFWESYSPERGQGNGTDITKQTKVEDIIPSAKEYSYVSFNKPSPFIPPLLSSNMKGSETSLVSVLQRQRIDQIQVVGIWTLENMERKALVITDEDEGVIVAVGDLIGKKGGKIVAIEPDHIKIREFNRAPDGTRQFEDIEKWLGEYEYISPSSSEAAYTPPPANSDTNSRTETSETSSIEAPINSHGINTHDISPHNINIQSYSTSTPTFEEQEQALSSTESLGKQNSTSVLKKSKELFKQKILSKVPHSADKIEKLIDKITNIDAPAAQQLQSASK